MKQKKLENVAFWLYVFQFIIFQIKNIITPIIQVTFFVSKLKTTSKRKERYQKNIY
jgi:hypothetical protein